MSAMERVSKSLKFIIIYVALFSGMNSLFAQTKYVESHLKPTFTDGWDTGGLLILGTGTVLGIAAHQYDDKVKRWFNKESRLGSGLTDFGNSFGTRYVNIVAAGIQMIWDRSNGLSHLEGLLGTNLMVFIMKKSIHRTRPNGENEDSFPSGHTSTAFASSGSLSYAYGWKAAIPAYTLTTLTLLARLEDNKHWLSDLVVATSIGVFWARSSGIHHHYLTPLIFNEGGGIQFSAPF
ncbi:MAG: phosphatase PAP2 family protein [Deltaproteobacteria bacterium]|nr:MAG: phosphatase PAP2 family protein [Deltaproteobacteria bacterium]